MSAAPRKPSPPITAKDSGEEVEVDILGAERSRIAVQKLKKLSAFDCGSTESAES